MMEKQMLEVETFASTAKVVQSFRGAELHQRVLKTESASPEDTATRASGVQLERVVAVPGVHFGKPTVAGTRITVESILELLDDGKTFGEITRDYYPDLTEADIRACIQFAISLTNTSPDHISSSST
jgi:uncharacterized protein (DUF433 family)